MTVSGSICTRVLIDRTLHLQRNTLPFPDYLVMRPLQSILPSHSHFFSSRAHLSNSSLFVPATCKQKYVSSIYPVSRPQRFILPRNFQSRYRRHLFYIKLLLQISRARRSLNQLSRLTIHSVQEFHVSRIQSRKNVFETNIVVIHDQIPQRISLPHPPLLRSRPHSQSMRSSSSSRRHETLSCRFVL